MMLAKYNNIDFGNDNNLETPVHIEYLEINRGDIILCQTTDDSNIILEIISNNIKSLKGEIDTICKSALICINDSFNDFTTNDLLLSINRCTRAFLKIEVINLLKDLSLEKQKINSLDIYNKRLLFILIALISRNDLVCIDGLFTDNSKNNNKIISVIKKISEYGAVIIKNKSGLMEKIFNRKLIFDEKNRLVKDINISAKDSHSKKEL